jgi:hypothetical protein
MEPDGREVAEEPAQGILGHELGIERMGVFEHCRPGRSLSADGDMGNDAAPPLRRLVSVGHVVKCGPERAVEVPDEIPFAVLRVGPRVIPGR